MTSTKQLLFGPRTVDALGALLLLGLLLQLAGWYLESPTCERVGLYLTLPFLLMLALLLLVVLPSTYFTSRRR